MSYDVEAQQEHHLIRQAAIHHPQGVSPDPEKHSAAIGLLTASFGTVAYGIVLDVLNETVEQQRSLEYAIAAL